jgi:chromosome segregation ATPase
MGGPGACRWHDAAFAGPARRITLPPMKKPYPCVAGLAVALMALAAGAQTPATKAIGTAKAGGKLLTREELRSCLAQQKDLGARRPVLQAERAQLDRERQELQQIDESLKADEAAMQKLTQSADDISRRTKELQQQIADYNDRAAKFQMAQPTGPTGDRQRRALDNDKAAIDKATAQLEADRAAIGPNAEQMAKTYKARADTRNQAAEAWNTRNRELTRNVLALDADQETFKADCEGRSYREDDEKAIQSGK